MAFMAAPLFASAPAWLTVGNTLMAGSTLLSLAGASSQASNMRKTAAANAENARAAAEANQRQLDYAAGQELAAGQHEAEAKRHKAALMLSRAQAVAAASGGGALDQTLMGGLVEAGEREAGYAMYGATEKAKGMQYRGAAGVAEAQNRSRAEIESANRSARSTMLGAWANAGSTMMSRFGGAGVPDQTGVLDWWE